jgi:hypothetical protein
MSPEMELLEQLDGGDMPFLLMERHAFEGDRPRALRSIEKMQADGLIELTIAGLRIEARRVATGVGRFRHDIGAGARRALRYRTRCEMALARPPIGPTYPRPPAPVVAFASPRTRGGGF